VRRPRPLARCAAVPERKLQALDLFSGIGGWAVGLRCISTVRAYCDNCVQKAAFLEEAMAAGTIHQAPVWCHSMESLLVSRGGARTLHPKLLQLMGEIRAGGNEFMITGSWPCTGYSARGKRLGLADPASRLVKPTVEIIRLAQPTVFMLENCPSAESDALALLEEALPNYELRYCIIDAASLGFAHTRERFVVMGVLRRAGGFAGTRLPRLPAHSLTELLPGTEPARAVRTKVGAYRQLLKALGDAVVPACMLAAYAACASECSAELLWPAPKALPVVVVSGDFAAPTQERSSRSGDLSPLVGSERLSMYGWATPRRGGGWWQYWSGLTVRGAQDLGAQVRHAADTPDCMRDFPLNPAWAGCWLMGYPPAHNALFQQRWC
jgi:hypothetical protein